MENQDSSVIRVFVVRHGQTAWNIEKILQGHQDIALNETGHSQARLLGSRFKDIDFDMWISSDLKRCIQTTQGIEAAVGADKVPGQFVKSPAFRERFMGDVEGMKIGEAKAKYGDGFRNRGEKKEDMIARIYKRWLECLAMCAQEGYRNVLLCTHGGVVRNFVNYLYHEQGYQLGPGMMAADLRVPYNTSVTVLDVKRADICAGTIERFGCTEHLGEQKEVGDKDLR